MNEQLRTFKRVKIRTIRVRLDTIVRCEEETKEILKDAVDQLNHPYIHGSHFLKLYILFLYGRQKKIPLITKQLIENILKTVADEAEMRLKTGAISSNEKGKNKTQRVRQKELLFSWSLWILSQSPINV